MFSFRKPTYVGQALKENTFELFDRFNVIKFRKDMQIIEGLNRIWNADETPIWFDMTYNTSISKIGEKSVKVCTFYGERLRVSLILSILAGGEKLPPLIIFKGTKNGPKENRQNDNIDVKNKEIFIRYNENYWAYEDLFYEWLNKKWFGTNAIIKPASKT